MRPNALRIDERDNVVTLLLDVSAGETVVWADGGPVRARQETLQGHKLAIAAIGAGEAIVKYGQPIGRAGEPIEPGDHVHTHNLASVRPSAPADARA